MRSCDTQETFESVESSFCQLATKDQYRYDFSHVVTFLRILQRSFAASWQKLAKNIAKYYPAGYRIPQKAPDSAGYQIYIRYPVQCVIGIGSEHNF